MADVIPECHERKMKDVFPWWISETTGGWLHKIGGLDYDELTNSVMDLQYNGS